MKPEWSLPEPSADALAHSDAVGAAIRFEIAASGGRIGFDRYFELTQYAPGLGYYSAGLTKFGREGDFVTAPELGDVFARGVLAALLPVLRSVPGAGILEIGCGSGALAADLLALLAQQNCLPAHYWLLERSADLRERQRATLVARVPELLARVRWLDAPPETLWRGVIVGNEIVDALPPKRFEITHRGPRELCVALNAHGELDYALGDELPEVAMHLADLPVALPLGYRSEFQPQLAAWLSGVSERMSAGLVLLFDYGYAHAHFYLPERTQGSLVCHYRHRMFDAPFVWPGLVDLSSSVNFTALARAGAACGLELAAYLSQADFLIATALPDLGALLQTLSERERNRMTRQIRLLTLPGEMGERIQLMAFARNLPQVARLAALQTLGLRHTL